MKGVVLFKLDDVAGALCGKKGKEKKGLVGRDQGVTVG